jgi:succinate dehydrogenase flavin-adding protein (antitoxin of CptAB toxin-antitoxin module)
MPDYDPGMEALVSELLRVLAPDVDTAALGYIEQMRALQKALVDLLSGAATVTSRGKPPGTEEGGGLMPEDEALVRFALGRLDPKTGDQDLEGGEVLTRLLACVDKDLFKWTSAMVQPVGPSGAAQVAVVEEA